MKRLLVCLGIILFTASGAGAFSYSDCGGTDCRWEEYPPTYYILDPLETDIDEEEAIAAIQASFDRWDHEHQTFCPPLQFTYGGRISTNDPDTFDRKNIVHFENDTWLYGPEALAVTSCWYDQNTGLFADCDISINAVDYQWSLDGAPGTIPLRPTLTHEIGHFWGLDHSNTRTATMYAYYVDKAAADDLDEDDIRAAADSFCSQFPPGDDQQEPNDSAGLARILPNEVELNGLRLYDDDWWQLQLAAGRRLKVTVQDENAARYKLLELYDENENLLDQQRCDGDCAQALGQAGDERSVYLRIYGDYDQYNIRSAKYSVALAQVQPGQEGELTDDDGIAGDDDDDDDSGGCGCSSVPDAFASPRTVLPAWFFLAALAGLMFVCLRKID